MNQADLLYDSVDELDRRPVHEIAAEKYHLHGISKPGLFDWVNESRHYIGPLLALRDNRTRDVNILKPVRGGGSVIGDVFLMWALDKDPGDYMQVLQTDDEVSSYVGKRTIPNLERSLPHLLPRLYVNSEGEIKLNNGYSLYMSGPGASNMQTKMIRYMHLDEPHMYKKGILAEANARLGDCRRLHISKLLCISQGGPPAGKSLEDHDWFHHYNEGEINEWEGQCPNCSQFHFPRFAGEREDGSFWGVTWDKHKLSNGDWDVRKCVESVRFHCPHCNYLFLDGPRIKSEWNRTGRYTVVGDSYVTKRSFHWEAVIMDNWRDLVELWLNACNAENRGNYLPKIQFYQKYRAIFMDESLLMRFGKKFGRLVVETASEWPDEFARFMTIDKQMEDTYWYLICAWSRDGRVRRLAFGKAIGTAELDDLTKQYKIPTFLSSGGKHSHVYIDCAFERLFVYQACCAYGWVALEGDEPQSGCFIHDMNGRKIARSYSKRFYGDPQRGKKGAGMTAALAYRFVKSTMNSRVKGLIDKGRIEHASDLGPETEAIYNDQMAGRSFVTTFDAKRGRKHSNWKESKEDHVLDCWNMQCVPATFAGILLDELEGIPAQQSS